MKSKWLEREWLAAIFTPVIVGILKHAGLDDETIRTMVMPPIGFIVGRLAHKAMIAHGAPAGQDGTGPPTPHA